MKVEKDTLFLITHRKEVGDGLDEGKMRTTQSRFHFFPKHDSPEILSVAIEPDARDVTKGNPTLPALQALSILMKDSGFEAEHSFKPERRQNHRLVYHYRKAKA